MGASLPRSAVGRHGQALRLPAYIDRRKNFALARFKSVQLKIPVLVRGTTPVFGVRLRNEINAGLDNEVASHDRFQHLFFLAAPRRHSPQARFPYRGMVLKVEQPLAVY